ncbi:MAG: DUF2066 domain-containing protein [Acetobacteraceae bacterium]
MRDVAATWLLLGLALAPGLAAAQGVPPDQALYTCRVYVTGTDMRSRPAGLERCVRDVLVKVAGAPDLAADPRLTELGTRAAQMVEDLVYLDRMTDEPIHDEQGTRDRPFDLVAHVDPQAVAGLLHELGAAAWVTTRPVLLAVVDVAKDGAGFPVTADGPQGERQRRALLAAGETFGMRVALPTIDRWPAPDQPLARAPGGVVALTGSMRWSEADAGWNCQWRLGDREWSISGVSFDEAFRAGVAGAVRILAAGRR